MPSDHEIPMTDLEVYYQERIHALEKEVIKLRCELELITQRFNSMQPNE